MSPCHFGARMIVDRSCLLLGGTLVSFVGVFDILRHVQGHHELSRSLLCVLMPPSILATSSPGILTIRLAALLLWSKDEQEFYCRCGVATCNPSLFPLGMFPPQWGS